MTFEVSKVNVSGQKDLAMSELTVVIAPTIVMMTFAMADITAFMPRPIAEKMLPCQV